MHLSEASSRRWEGRGRRARQARRMRGLGLRHCFMILLPAGGFVSDGCVTKRRLLPEAPCLPSHLPPPPPTAVADLSPSDPPFTRLSLLTCLPPLRLR